MKRTTTLGLVWLIAPVLLLVLTLAIFGAIQSMTASVGVSIIKIILGLLGIVAVVGIPVGIVVAIRYFLKSGSNPA